MQIHLVTLFPEMFAALSEYGITGRAVQNKLVTLEFWNPREFATDRHHTVDSRPYGGGPGMLMKSEPLVAAIRAAREALQARGLSGKVVYLSPQGHAVTQRRLKANAGSDALVLVCGRYQGLDQRILDSEIDEEWSVGDFVVSGGELPAMMLVDGLIRLQPGALGDEDSLTQDSFYNDLLHWPEYTKPREFEGRKVPQVLFSGDHAAIERWRTKHSLGTTWLKRPDLLQDLQLSDEQAELLAEYKAEFNDHAQHNVAQQADDESRG